MLYCFILVVCLMFTINIIKILVVGADYVLTFHIANSEILVLYSAPPAEDNLSLESIISSIKSFQPEQRRENGKIIK